MSDPRDFQLGAAKPVGSPSPSATPAPGETAPEPEPETIPAQPMVVIQYRNRGLPAYLIPPLLIIFAAIGIMSYQHLTPPPRLVTAQETTAAKPPEPPASGVKGRTIEVESGETGTTPGPIVVNTEPVKAPEPVVVNTEPAKAPEPVVESAPPPPAPTTVVLDPASRPAEIVEAPTSNPPTPLAVPPAVAAAPTPITDPRALFALETTDGLRPVTAEMRKAKDQTPREIVVDPPSSPPAEAAPAVKPEPARSGIGFTPPPEGAVPNPQPAPEPLPSIEEIERSFRLEAEQREAEQRDLARLKPQARQIQRMEAARRAVEQRTAFRKQLHEILKTGGEEVGQHIEELCTQYGREIAPEQRDAVARHLRRSNVRMTRQDRVDVFRIYGIPESAILDNIARDWDRRLMNARGGTRNQDDVRVKAAWELLSFPLIRQRTAKPTSPKTEGPVPAAAPPLAGAATAPQPAQP